MPYSVGAQARGAPFKDVDDLGNARDPLLYMDIECLLTNEHICYSCFICCDMAASHWLHSQALHSP